MKHFGNELYRIIEEKRLVKKQIAEAIGMAPTHFSQLMKKSSFDPATLERICKVIGVSPGYFFDDWTSEKYTIGDINNQTVVGDATVSVGSSAAVYEKLLAEKERVIQILLRQCGMDSSIDV